MSASVHTPKVLFFDLDGVRRDQLRQASERPELSTFAVGDWPPLIDQIIDAPGAKVLHTGDTADTTRQTVAWAEAAVTERDPDVVGAIVQPVRSRPAYGEEEWPFLATTDHGHTDQAYPTPGHGGSEPEVRQIWTLASGAGIPAVPLGGEAQLVDLLPTVLAHLGVDIDPAWELDGTPLI